MYKGTTFTSYSNSKYMLVTCREHQIYETKKKKAADKEILLHQEVDLHNIAHTSKEKIPDPVCSPTKITEMGLLKKGELDKSEDLKLISQFLFFQNTKNSNKWF